MAASWTLGAESFARLLALLDADREKAALRYEELRERLVRVFVWEHAVDAEGLADEALTRMARRLDEGEAIQNPAAFLNGIARNLLKEDRHRRQRMEPLRELPAAVPNEEVERHHAALERCLAGWEADKRKLLLAYYQGDQSTRIRNRQRLAGELGLEINALRNRALRLRERLEACVRQQIARDVSGWSATTDRKGKA
jgi:DNA-directed RNA polymerase specialized sigma24 family protein